MPINFPSTPTLNQTYSEGQRTWKFNGTAWNLDTSLLPVGPTGPTGPAGASINATPSFTMVTITGNVTASTDVATKSYVDSAVSGVDISDTDGLSEGTINKYFTDERAIAAINNATAISLTGDLTLSANTTITGHIIPTSNVTYDLGATGSAFRDLYLSGSTIHLGSVQISTAGGALVLPANTTVSGGGSLGVTTLDGLTDVTITSPSADQVLKYDGTTWVNGTGGGASISVTDDTSTNATRYVLFEDVTSGNVSSVGVSSSKLYYNPSTGTLNATVFNSLSDATFKEDIEPITGALANVNRLQGVSFNWTETGDHSYGVIAQDVERVIAEAVSTNEKGIKSVNYQQITAFLIEAVKELSAKVAALEKK